MNIAATVLLLIPVLAPVAIAGTHAYPDDGRVAGRSYGHEISSGSSPGVVRFEMRAPSGTLDGRLDEGDGYARVTLTHRDSGSRMIMTRVARADSGAGFHLSLSGTGENLYFDLDPTSGEITLAARIPGDCGSPATRGLVETIRESVALLDDEFRGVSRPPARLSEVAGATLFASELLQASECVQEYLPHASGCNLDHDTYSDCVACCHQNSQAAGFLCNVAASAACSGTWCQTGCGALVDMSKAVCSTHNCRGMSGDPGCRAPLPECPRCMDFCGPGRSSACGLCPDGKVCCD
jgi:hypothetical protein